MVTPLVTTILIFMGALGFYAADLVQMIDQSARLARLKAHIANVETSARIILMSPGSYQCTSTGGVNDCSFVGLTGPKGGKYNGTAPVGTPMHTLAKLIEPLDAVFCSSSQGYQGSQGSQIHQHAQTAASSSCGLKISKTPTIVRMAGEPTPVITMELEFEGKFSLAPITITVRPSAEILQSLSAQCAGIFEGFNPDGTIKCRPKVFSRAPEGYYISSLNLETYAAQFSRLPALVDDCTGQDQFLSGYEWKGGEEYVATCGSRVSPFATR